MRRVTVVIPYLVSDPEAESALRPLPDALRHIVENGAVVKLAPLPQTATPEAAFLALDPARVQVAQGPLTVAALGHRPPERSVHFHLTLCSVDEAGHIRTADGDAPNAAIDKVFEAAERLRTPTLTPLRGEHTDHALVWEDGSLEMQTTPFADAVGRGVLERVPRGEGEQAFRKFIDDSVNLLDTLELNHERREEGLSPLNCLWPWGQGARPDLPSLPLRRGDVAHVVSASLRMQGLCRLVGYAHGDRRRFGRGLQTDFDKALENAQGHRLSLAVVQTIEEMQRHRRPDEIAHNLEQLNDKVVRPLLENAKKDPFELRVAAPGGHSSTSAPPERASSTGLAIAYSSLSPRQNPLPFDERVLDDPRAGTVQAWEFLAGGFVGDQEPVL